MLHLCCMHLLKWETAVFIRCMETCGFAGNRAAGVECKQYFSRGYLKVALVRIIAWQIERENADRLIGLATWGHNGECSSTREYSGRLTGFDPANVCTVKAVREMSCYDYVIHIKHVNKSNTCGFTAVYSGTEKKKYNLLSEGLYLYVPYKKTW